jgi:VIT1/CCC1 family predicted Fe2+/Mn2+ transporter
VSAGDRIAGVFHALAGVLGPVSPWLAALWLVSAMVLAVVLVYGWHRVRRP